MRQAGRVFFKHRIRLIRDQKISDTLGEEFRARRFHGACLVKRGGDAQR
jgi:hypothetical protein